MRRFTILLLEDKEQGGYWVEVPALPGCYSQGDTLDEAMRNAREAIELHIAGMLADGEPIPDDSGAPRVESVEVAA